eukprot:835582_1
MNALRKVDYLLDLCDQYLDGKKFNPPLTLPQISRGDTVQFLEEYMKKDIFSIIKKANQFKIKALNVFEYKCIKYNMFIVPRLQRHPKFNSVIKTQLLSTNATILDIGCCFGTDLRYCLYLGCKKHQVLGVDISSDFIELGFDFFGDKSVLKNRFISDDILGNDGCDFVNHALELNNHKRFDFFGDKSVLKNRFISDDILGNDGCDFVNHALELNNHKRFDVIYIGNVYHLLTEKQCELLTTITTSLISTNNGIVYGSTVGCDVPGEYLRKNKTRYLHSKQSLQEMMKTHGTFKNIVVETNEKAVQRMTRYHKPSSTDNHYTYLNFFCRT